MALATAMAWAPGAANATDFTWIGATNTDGLWSRSSNWSPRGVPGAADTVFISGGKAPVHLSGDLTVKNLRIGQGATINNAGRITVTGWTDSDGVVVGAGLVDIPKGATATFELNAPPLAASSQRLLARGKVAGGLVSKSNAMTTAPIEFGKIENSGNMNIRVAAAVDVNFQDIKNEGGDTVLSAMGSSDVVKSVASAKNVAGMSSLQSGLLAPEASELPIRLKSLKNEWGRVTLTGTGAKGRAFQGEAIENNSEFVFNGALALLKNDYKNFEGAVVTLQGGSSILPIEGVKKFENFGLVRQTDGASEIKMEWANAGQLVVDGGTLKIAPEDGKTCAQIGGSTTLHDGTLEIADASNQGLLLQGGTLNGSGTIIGDVKNSGGRVQVGHSPGMITINGNYSQTANGILDMEIWGTAPGAQYDQLRVEGDAYLAGTLNIVTGNNFVPGSGNAFTHMTYVERIGAFSRINIVNPVAGRTYRTTYATAGVMSTTVVSAPVNPAVSILAPLQNSTLRTGTTVPINGLASGGNEALSGVRVKLYRFASDRAPAGYWAGGINWSTNSGTTVPANVVGEKWNLAVSGLVPARYAVRATATNVKGVAVTAPDVMFWVSTSSATVDLSTASVDANGETVRLAFASALDTITAIDLSRYVVRVNGRALRISRVTVSGSTVTLTLPADSVAPGNVVAVEWTNLFTPTGATLSGSVSRSVSVFS